MTLQPKFDRSDIVPIDQSARTDQYEEMNEQAEFDSMAEWTRWILGALQRRFLLATAIAFLLSLLAVVAYIVTPPEYTSEAVLELNFNREEAPTLSSSRQVASMDPGALVNGAALSIASRANASRVVDRLGLHLNGAPKPSIVSNLTTALRSAFGVVKEPLTAHEIAIEDLQRNLKVSSKSHLYQIGIAYTDPDPRLAAQMANALALEHLRGERLKELTDKWSAAVREFVAVSEAFGERHPRYIQTKGRVDHLESQIDAVEKMDARPENLLLAGQFLTLAEPVLTPSGTKKRLLVLAIGLCLAVGLGILAALLAQWLSDRKAQRQAAQFEYDYDYDYDDGNDRQERDR